MERVEEFYRIMESTIETRRTLVAEYLARKEKDGDLEEGTLAEKEVRQLEEVSARLQDMPRNEEGHLLFLDEQDREFSSMGNMN